MEIASLRPQDTLRRELETLLSEGVANDVPTPTILDALLDALHKELMPRTGLGAVFVGRLIQSKS